MAKAAKMRQEYAKGSTHGVFKGLEAVLTRKTEGAKPHMKKKRASSEGRVEATGSN
jgi:hypothetical protein